MGVTEFCCWDSADTPTRPLKDLFLLHLRWDCG